MDGPFALASGAFQASATITIAMERRGLMQPAARIRLGPLPCAGSERSRSASDARQHLPAGLLGEAGRETMTKPTAKYTEDEIAAIRRYAGHGGPGYRDDAVQAHQALMTRVLRQKQALPYGDLYFEFMREVDCKMPDLGLRATYRARIKAEMPA